MRRYKESAGGSPGAAGGQLIRIHDFTYGRHVGIVEAEWSGAIQSAPIQEALHGSTICKVTSFNGEGHFAVQKPAGVFEFHLLSKENKRGRTISQTRLIQNLNRLPCTRTPDPTRRLRSANTVECNLIGVHAIDPILVEEN
jgi:hypothetical protein